MLSYQLIIIIIVIISIILLLLLIDKRMKEYNKIIKKSLTTQQPINIINQESSRPIDPIKLYDDKKITDIFEAPAKRPERIQMGYNPIMKSSNNPLDPYPTRGYPDNYHLLGTISAIETDNTVYDKLSQDNKILSLFGRQKYPGSSVYEYHTMISTGNTMIKLPIDNKRELFNDDTVDIKELNTTYKVQLYPNEELKYNPFII